MILKVDAQFTSIYPNLKMKNEEHAQYNMYINALSGGIKDNYINPKLYVVIKYCLSELLMSR